MYSKLSHYFLASILLISSTGSSASLLLGPDLEGYSVIAGAALNISANAIVTDDVAARAAVGIGAQTDTANIYSGAAVVTGAGGNSGDIYAGAAAGIAALGSATNIYAEAAVTLGAGGTAGDIYAGAAVTLAAGSSSGDVIAGGAVTGAGFTNKTASTPNAAPAVSSYKATFDIAKAIQQIADAQTALSSLEHDFELDVGMGNFDFEPGIYKGTALTIAADSTIRFDGEGAENPLWIFNLSSALTAGARNKFEIINAGAGASVIWNLGGSLVLGAGNSFIGATFITGAAAGATSDVTCGNLFTTSAIGIGSTISTNCKGSDTWAGSVNGMADGVDITDGVVTNTSVAKVSVAKVSVRPQTVTPPLVPVPVPAPSTGLLFGIFALLLFAATAKRKCK